MDLKKQIKLYPLVAGAAVVALVLGGLSVWRASVFAETGRQLEMKEAESRQLAENVRAAQKLDVHLQRLTELNSQTEARMTDSKDIAGNQQYFYNIEAETGTKIVDLRKVQLVEERGKKTAAKTFSANPYSLVVEGDYGAIMSFVRRVESGQRFARIVEATLSPTTTQHAGPPSESATRAGPLLISATLKVEFISKS